jgi:hypothetical protein
MEFSRTNAPRAEGLTIPDRAFHHERIHPMDSFKIHKDWPARRKSAVPFGLEFLSGTELGLTLGTPLTMLVRNTDHRPRDYAEMSQVPRPSHADLT